MNLSKLQSESVKEFNKWWKERFGEQYVGTYPQGDFEQFLLDQIQKAVEETRKEDIEIIENLKVKHSINPNSPSRERKIIYNNAIEEAKLSIQSKGK